MTIDEIARQLGVSKTTVSRVINNKPDVSPETRKRIQDLIDSHGYQPNANAISDQPAEELQHRSDHPVCR